MSVWVALCAYLQGHEAKDDKRELNPLPMYRFFIMKVILKLSIN